MAITIISNLVSGGYYPSSNLINTTVYSNNNGSCNFRYICDIYVNGVKVFTQKLFPDPTTGYGFFQLERVLQDYIETNIPKAPQTTYFALSAKASAPTSLISLYCKFGEEYDSSSACDGVVNQYLNLATSNTSYVFEAAIDYQDFPSFDYTKYTFATAAATASFLTNSPREIEVTYNDSYYLDFISTAALTSSRRIGIELYDKNGQLITSYLPAATSLANTRRYRIAVGPYDLNKLLNTPAINQSVAYYTVVIGNLVGITFTKLTETFRFKVVEPRAFQTRIAFIGLKGGIEHFTFYYRNTARYELERKTYERTLQRNYSNKLAYQVGDRGTTQYSMRAREKHTVSSYCSREVSQWLNEMWLSPNVWTYLRPELKGFEVYVETAEFFYEGRIPVGGPPIALSRVLFWCKDHGLKVGDEFFCFPDTTDANNAVLEQRFTVTSVIDENRFDCGLTLNNYPNLAEPCGYIQKKQDWQTLPIVISDNTIEIKQKLTRPVEYTLNYDMAYTKNTLR